METWIGWNFPKYDLVWKGLQDYRGMFKHFSCGIRTEDALERIDIMRHPYRHFCDGLPGYAEELMITTGALLDHSFNLYQQATLDSVFYGAISMIECARSVSCE